MMVNIALLFGILTSVVTLVAGAPYVAKFSIWLLIQPDFNVMGGPSNDVWIKHHHETPMIVDIEYHHSESLSGPVDGNPNVSMNALIAVREYGPFLLPSGEFLTVKPRPEIEQTRKIELTIRPRMRLSDFRSWIPAFWGETELRPQRLRCEVGPEAIPDPNFHQSE